MKFKNYFNENMKITYALTSDDNMLVNNTRDIILDLQDEFDPELKGLIDDYDINLDDPKKPKITFSFSPKGAKLNGKIKKSLKSSGFIK